MGSDTVDVNTSVIPEVTNLYYTDARAQATAQAVSINNVVEDTTQLGAALDTQNAINSRQQCINRSKCK